ncbi:lipase maturation factor 1 [Dryobates pubescens]|uniref:lipase maturation factor 1 n=1 Tax=Dryobates pubescens TaxID=118200 RepID=UPI0023B95899|nr:lipase maturation factor 1 [Dryobates pubescens]
MVTDDAEMAELLNAFFAFSSGGVPCTGSGGVPCTGSGGVPCTGSGGVPRTGSGGVPRTGGSGVPRTGGSGVPRTGGSGVPRTGGSGVPRTGGSGSSVPRTGSGGVPRTGSGGVPRTGGSGVPRTGGSGVPRTGGSGVPRTGGSGVPCTGGSGSGGVPCTGGGGVPRTGSSGVPRTGGSGVPRTGSSGVPCTGSSGVPCTGGSGVPCTGSSGVPRTGSSTQPVPNPIAYFLHRSPWWFHRLEALVNHFIELVVPFFIFLGRRMCLLHGLLQILFQVLLILSGNLSFLNWLTIIPSLACFDDRSLGFLFSRSPGGLRQRLARMQLRQASEKQLPLGCHVRRVVNVSFGLLVAYLSIPVVLNLLSSRQVMNTSFTPLRIVNTYGAFGSITKERTEVVLQGTASLDPNDPAAVWEEYEFKCKPGALKRRPCFISPYHYRLDWLMWFAAFQTYEQNEWIIHLAGKLLAQEEQTLSLLATNPFAGREPPRWIRGEHFKYRFSRPGGRHAAQGSWWLRKRLGPYFPPVNLQGLKKFYEARSWPYPVGN